MIYLPHIRRRERWGRRGRDGVNKVPLVAKETFGEVHRGVAICSVEWMYRRRGRMLYNSLL